MTFIYNIVELLACFVELYILYKIYGNLFAVLHNNKGKMCFLLSVCGTLLVRACNSVADFSYFTIMILIFYTSFTAYGLYRRNYLLCFSVASFYILCLSCFDFLIFSFISNLFNGYGTFIKLVTQKSFLRTIVIVFIKGLWILLYKVVRKKLFIFSEKQNNLKVLFMMTIAGYMSFVYLANQTFKTFGDKTSNIWFIFIVVFALIILILMLSWEIKKERMKLNLSELRNEFLEEKYHLVSDVYSKNAKLYHDLNKHLNVLYQLLETEKINSAKEYIEEISKPVTKLSKTIWTGVDIIDVIINTELDKMNTYGITADINIEFPKKTNLLPNDMCTILTNLLDNAIEAVQRLENPKNISLTMRVVNHFLLIKVKNKCVDDTKFFTRFPETTKDNKKLHGWGLTSVEETVRKYNGKMKCVRENGHFVVTIMMMFELHKE